MATTRGEYRSRSREMVEVGYFLARFSEARVRGKPLPPDETGARAWGAAYDIFHEKLGCGRPLIQFRNTLKNSRDEFDGFFDNGRQGWKESDGTPARLRQLQHAVFEELQLLDRDACWKRIRQHASG